MLKYIILSLLFVGCGTKNSVDVSPVKGQIDIVNKVDIKGAADQITEICAQQFPDEKDKQNSCFKDNITSFFKILNPGGTK